jgi:hypothetical protein
VISGRLRELAAPDCGDHWHMVASRSQGLVLDDQHTQKLSTLRAGAYRRHIENRIHAGNTALP